MLRSINMEQNIQKTSFLNNQSFGELSIMKNQGRAGTCIAAVDSYLAVITKFEYERLLSKHQQFKIQMSIKFIRQIEFISNQTTKEVVALHYMLRLQ